MIWCTWSFIPWKIIQWYLSEIAFCAVVAKKCTCLLHKHYVNMMSLSQDYLPSKCCYANVNWAFQKCYCESSYLKKLQKCDLSKMEFRKNCLLRCPHGLIYLPNKMFDFFGPPNLTGHSFAAPWSMMMHSSSFAPRCVPLPIT